MPRAAEACGASARLETATTSSSRDRVLAARAGNLGQERICFRLIETATKRKPVRAACRSWPQRQRGPAMRRCRTRSPWQGFDRWRGSEPGPGQPRRSSSSAGSGGHRAGGIRGSSSAEWSPLGQDTSAGERSCSESGTAPRASASARRPRPCPGSAPVQLAGDPVVLIERAADALPAGRDGLLLVLIERCQEQPPSRPPNASRAPRPGGPGRLPVRVVMRTRSMLSCPSTEGAARVGHALPALGRPAGTSGRAVEHGCPVPGRPCAVGHRLEPAWRTASCVTGPGPCRGQ